MKKTYKITVFVIYFMACASLLFAKTRIIVSPELMMPVIDSAYSMLWGANIKIIDGNAMWGLSFNYGKTNSKYTDDNDHPRWYGMYKGKNGMSEHLSGTIVNKNVYSQFYNYEYDVGVVSDTWNDRFYLYSTAGIAISIEQFYGANIFDENVIDLGGSLGLEIPLQAGIYADTFDVFGGKFIVGMEIGLTVYGTEVPFGVSGLFNVKIYIGLGL